MRFEKEVRQQYIIANEKASREQRSSLKQNAAEHPVVLERILDVRNVAYTVDLGRLEIPTNQIVGFSAADQKEQLYAPNFMPLAKANSDFAKTWRYLYQEYLDDQVQQPPIQCYEYLGKFYVHDGAKRVSFMKHHGASAVMAEVTRIMPTITQDLKIQNYYAFLQHFGLTQLYQVSFTHPEYFDRLQAALGHEANYRWNETDRFGFLFHWYNIESAFYKAYEDHLSITPADALVVLLEKYSYNQIIKMPSWVLVRVFQAQWKQIYELNAPVFFQEKTQKFAGVLQTA